MAYDPRLRSGIIEAANALGVDPVDLATAISYETGGTFDPSQKGPRTKWGQHRGLIQFGEPQAKQYGVNWDDPLGSQLGANGAIVRYFKDRGVKPGTNMLDLYSTVNAGAPGRYDATDSGSTVRQKVNSMGAHRRKAQALLGDDTGETSAAPVGRVARYDPSLGPEGAVDFSRAQAAQRETPAAVPGTPADRSNLSLEARDEAAAAAPTPGLVEPEAKKKGWLDAMSKGLGKMATAMAPNWQPLPSPNSKATQMTPGQMQPTFDPQQSELQRQQLAQALARLNSGQLWG